MKKILFITLSVILSLIIILVAVYFIMLHTGEKKLKSHGAPPKLPTIEDTADDLLSSSADIDSTEDESYSVRYNGKKYKYNDSMISVLFMGIDSETPVVENELHGNGGQADVLFLACIDTSKKNVRILQIPRDTICEVEIFDYYGDSAGTYDLPIALSHAYGDGAEKSGELTASTVSELLYGLKVNAWMSLNMSAIQTLNDSIGGVTIVATEENVEFLPRGTSVGESVVLKGNYARKFIVHRYEGNDSTRRTRQKEYLSSFISTAKKAIKNNPSLILDIYNDVEKWTCTTLSVDELVWLGTEIIEMDINTDFTSLKGVEQEQNNRVEYIIDEKALCETMLEIFYLEVE